MTPMRNLLRRHGVHDWTDALAGLLVVLVGAAIIALWLGGAA